MIRKIKKIRYFLLVSIFIIVGVFFAFELSFKKVHNLILDKDIDQMVYTSSFVTKLVESEIENKVSELSAATRLVLEYKEISEKEMLERLEILRKDLNFEKIGISNLYSEAIDSEGKKIVMDNPQLLETIRDEKTYISNSLEDRDCLIFATPIFNKDNVILGFVWVHYRVIHIAEDIKLNPDSHRYFQIIDDSGQYISDSNNIYSFAQNENIWEEIKQYELSDGITVRNIKQDVLAGKSGQFYFSYKGQGRYVAYEPLGINNWYVFSVITKDYLNNYVLKIEVILFNLLGGIMIVIVFLVATIGRNTYKATAFIKKQNDILVSKNSLLFMTLKHTNDIPFEINLKKRTICIYYAKPDEKVIADSLENYYPKKMLENGLIERESYNDYKKIFDNMMNLRQSELIPIKFVINGFLDINQIYYEISGDDKIIGCLEDYNEQAQQYYKIEEISKKSQIDAMTKLYNREYFKYEVEKLMQERESNNSYGYSALFILDLDHFKEANDTLGHIIGDEILVESATIIKKIVRNTDICGRLGGDEFVLFMQNVKNIKAIEVCAEKINKALKRTYGYDEKNVSITASIGIAIWTKETTFQELYQLADKALYKTKESGKDGYYIFL